MHIYLEIIISLIGLYIVFSIINSIVVEWIGELFNARGRYLKSKLFQLLSGKEKSFNLFYGFIKFFSFENRKAATRKFSSESLNFGDRFYAHPLLKTNFKSEYRWPNQIDKGTFAETIISILKPVMANYHPKLGVDYSNVDVQIPDFIRENVELSLLSVPEEKDRYSHVKKSLEEFYENYSVKLSFWYKSRIQIWLFFVGIAGAVFFNIDTIKMYENLMEDGNTRRSLYQQARVLDQNRDQVLIDTIAIKELLSGISNHSVSKENAFDQLVSSIKVNDEQIEPSKYTSLGIGYGRFKMCLSSLIGVILTGIALSFGSTFWFDILRSILKFK